MAGNEGNQDQGDASVYVICTKCDEQVKMDLTLSAGRAPLRICTLDQHMIIMIMVEQKTFKF